MGNVVQNALESESNREEAQNETRNQWEASLVGVFKGEMKALRIINHNVVSNINHTQQKTRER